MSLHFNKPNKDIEFRHVNIVTVQNDRKSYASIRPEYDFKTVCVLVECLACGALVINQEVHEEFHISNKL